jgi:quaternary ammonium compound-resistance protein SugE
MAWVHLLIAGLLEVAWAVGLKYCNGFTRLWPSVWTIVGMIASFFFLSQAIRHLPIGSSYAIWTGIGAVGTAILGVLLFDESVSTGRIVSVALVIVGIVGLKLTAGS